MFRLTLLGVGAMNSPRFAPAGLLIVHEGSRVVLDGGPGAAPEGAIDAWLVTDRRAELIREIRGLAAATGLAHIGRPTIRAMDSGDRPPFGTFGKAGAVYEPRRWRNRAETLAEING